MAKERHGQLRRLNEMERALYRIYLEQNGQDPKRERLCKALDILEGARYEIAMLANEESKAIKEEETKA